MEIVIGIIGVGALIMLGYYIVILMRGDVK